MRSLLRSVLKDRAESTSVLLLFELIIFKCSWSFNFHSSLEYLLPNPQKTREEGNSPKSKLQEHRAVIGGVEFSNFCCNQQLCKPPHHHPTRGFLLQLIGCNQIWHWSCHGSLVLSRVLSHYFKIWVAEIMPLLSLPNNMS